jgi:hypothetical protein
MADTLWKYTVDLHFKDSGANDTHRTIEIDAEDISEALTNAVLIRAAYAAASDAHIVAYSIAAHYYDDAFELPAAGVQCENTGQVTLQLLNAAKTGTIDIPALKDICYVAEQGPNANIVDIADALVTNVTDLYDATGEAFLSDGEKSQGPLKGVRVHTRSGRRRSQRMG